MKILVTCLATAILASGCDTPAARKVEEGKRACVDTATLLATTAGSPNVFSCWHEDHRMEVSVATLAGEEIGSTVTCRCIRDAGVPKKAP